MTRLVGLSISGMPGPPFGPKYRNTATVFSPFLMDPLSMAWTKSDSTSNARHLPLNCSPSLPVIFETAPPGARFPRRMLTVSLVPGVDPPNVTRLLDGVRNGSDNLLILPLAAMLLNPALTILSKGPPSDRHFVARHDSLLDEEVNHAGDASDSVDILHDVFAARFEIGEEWYTVRDFLKVVNGECNAHRMGNGDEMEDCVGGAAEGHGEGLGSAARQRGLTIAFSNAPRVIMSRGRMLSSSRRLITPPTESHSLSFSGYSAGKEDEPGRAMPRASVADAMVFAVYICRKYRVRIGLTPPHAPGPGQAFLTVSYRIFSASSVCPIDKYLP